MSTAAPPLRPDLDLSRLDEPVRRYFAHALSPTAPPPAGMRLAMTGRSDVGVRLPFVAEWEGDGRSFRWSAKAGPLRSPLLHVVDQFADGRGSMDVRLLGRAPLVHADDTATTRSAAGRAAAEAIWTPASLLPQRGVTWEALGDDLIVATWDVPPERPQLRLHIDPHGAVRTCSVMRWNTPARGYVPCGGDVLAERTFGGVTIPSRISVGWWYGTAHYQPFFEAEVTGAAAIDPSGKPLD